MVLLGFFPISLHGNQLLPHSITKAKEPQQNSSQTNQKRTQKFLPKTT